MIRLDLTKRCVSRLVCKDNFWKKSLRGQCSLEWVTNNWGGQMEKLLLFFCLPSFPFKECIFHTETPFADVREGFCGFSTWTEESFLFKNPLSLHCYLGTAEISSLVAWEAMGVRGWGLAAFLAYRWSLCFCSDGRAILDSESQKPHSSDGRRYPNGRISWDMGDYEPHSSEVMLLQGKGIVRYRSPGTAQLWEEASSAEALQLLWESIPSWAEDLRILNLVLLLCFFPASLHSFLTSSDESHHAAPHLIKRIYSRIWGPLSLVADSSEKLNKR